MYPVMGAKTSAETRIINNVRIKSTAGQANERVNVWCNSNGPDWFKPTTVPYRTLPRFTK